MIADRYFSGWCHSAIVSDGVLRLFARTWHVEFVLRHLTYACLRLINGRDWETALKPPNMRKKATGFKDDAIQKNEYPANWLPNLVWFLGANDLIKVIDGHWKDVFQSVFRDWTGNGGQKSSLESFVSLRNRLAHFRPISEVEGERVFASVFDRLGSDVRNWLARYVNSSNSSSATAECRAIVTAFQQKHADAVPISTEPISGYHGGLRNLDAEGDRGWLLYLTKNEAGNAFWVEPTPVGFNQNLGLEDVRFYAIALREQVAHVMVNYHKGARIDDTNVDGFENLRISIPQADGTERILDSLKTISDLTMERKMTPISGIKSSEEHGLDELSPELVAERLFYDTPFNVLINPTQDEAVTIRVGE